MPHLVGTVVRPLARWAESSQRTACRNAMTASTALTDRRRERDETQEVVEALLAHRAGRAGGVPAQGRTARLG